MNYNLFQRLTEEQKERYIVTSKSTDDYPHLYTPAYSPSRHFSACIESNMDAAQRKDICRYAIFLTQGKCAYCGDTLINLKNGKKYRSKDLNWDHIYPASKCNILTYGNVLLSCSDCNIKKSDNDTLTWFKEQLDNDEFPNALFTYEEFEALLKQEFEQYSKDYPWVRVVNTRYFHNRENRRAKELTLRAIHDELEVYSFSQNSVNNYQCSDYFKKELNILIEKVPEEAKTYNFNLATSYFFNNFGHAETFLTEDLITSLLDYNNFIFAFEVFLSTLNKHTFSKVKSFAEAIIKYYFKKDYKFPSYRERIVYLKDVD